MKMTIKDLLDRAEELFHKADKGDQLLDVRLLLQKVLNCDYPYIIINMDKIVDESKVDQFFSYINMRLEGVPYQYIVGEQNFMGYDFYVSKNTLIPRSDTEILVELVNKIIAKEHKKNILDIGTGTGCIPLSIALYNSQIQCTGIDISSKALEIAKKNCDRYNLSNRVDLKLSNLFEELDEVYYNKFDIIISNPPYIPTSDIDSLMEEVKDNEPVLALDGGDDGLDFYKKITKDADKYLSEGGYLVFEIGHDQFEEVYDILELNNFKEISYKEDLQGYRRVIYGIKNRGE